MKPDKLENVGDTISRQAAIDEMQEYWRSLNLRRRRIPLAAEAVYMDLKGVVATLPSAEPQRWISVSERLPEKSGRYIVTRGLNACGALWNRVYILNYSDLMGLKNEKIWWDGNVGKSDFTKYEDITAWMPLPECYRGDENGESDG